MCDLQEIALVKPRIENSFMSLLISRSTIILRETDRNQCIDFKSARVRLASGLLCYLSSHIHPSSNDLKWLSDDVCILANVYMNVSRTEALQPAATEEDKSSLLQLCTCYPLDLLSFFEFILNVKEALKAWNLRLQNKQVTFQHIEDLFLLVEQISCLTNLLMLSSDIRITKTKLLSMQDDYQYVVTTIECLLVRRVPCISDTKW